MYRATLQQLSCFVTHDAGHDEYRLTIEVDGREPPRNTISGNINNRESTNINRSFDFEEFITIKLEDRENWPYDDDNLGIHTIRASAVHGQMVLSFNAGAGDFFNFDSFDFEAYDYFDYALTVLISKNGVRLEDLNTYSLRNSLSIQGKGEISSDEYAHFVEDKRLYRIGDEMVSFKTLFNEHAVQDGNKSETNSIQEWITTHTDYFSPHTLRISKPAHNSFLNNVNGRNWIEIDKPVIEHVLKGHVYVSKLTSLDSPISHETFDWNFNLFPDATYMYLWGAGAKHTNLENIGKNAWDENIIPYIHNEWESGSFPLEWRPAPGQYCIIRGRYVWDSGHVPLTTEIHPPNTIVNIGTSAASIGSHNRLVPVNTATIGLGASGGFTGSGLARWHREAGGAPDDALGDAEDCYFTNIAAKPFRFDLFPPVPQPNEEARLVFKVRLCQHISVDGLLTVDMNRYLNKCTDNSPEEVNERAHRLWGTVDRYPAIDTPEHLQPIGTLVNNAVGAPSHYSVQIDLSELPDVPVGYYAKVECGWSTVAESTAMHRYRVEFEQIDVSDLGSFEWSYYFGVNNEMRAHWFGFQEVTAETLLPEHKRAFDVNLVDDMPLIIHDGGIDRDPGDWVFTATELDKVLYKTNGPNVLQSIIDDEDVTSDIVGWNDELNEPEKVRFELNGKGGDTNHTLHMSITKLF